MKKILFTLPIVAILLLAASCNSPQPTNEQIVPPTNPSTNNGKISPSPVSTDNTNSTSKDSSVFCSNQSDQVKKLLAGPKPDDYIKSSQNRERLELWKELFIKNNGITNDFFQNHVRIIKDGTESFNGEHFEVYYNYIFDWVNVEQNNRFITNKTLDEIRSMFNNTFNPKTGDPVADSLNYITDVRVNGVAIQSSVNCDQLIKIVKEKNKKLVPDTKTDFIIGDVRLYADTQSTDCKGYSGTGKSSRMIISVLTGKILLYDSNSGCPID